MRKVHYQNVGFPRSGTTWLWVQLINNPAIDYNERIHQLLKLPVSERTFDVKENESQLIRNDDTVIGEKIAVDLTAYVNEYKDYDITYNFCPFTCRLPPESITDIEQYTTHATLILRNPYDLLQSWFNFAAIDFVGVERWKKQYDWFNYPKVVKKWMKFKNFKLLYYDDLANNQEAFYEEVCDFIGIPPAGISKSLINEAQYKRVLHHDRLSIRVVNFQIDQLSELLSRDFSHWKKPE